ncbi:MAG TPA: thioredoxin fold domain-containing protein [Ignavibacteriales bacterium]|nr:thioredoxin fold domain-containing protein [Ignavibacteriales bacterium]
MKRKITLLIVVLIAILGSAAFYYPAPEEVKWTNFDKGLEASKKENKKVVVDVYTDWCSWCKKMDASTYKNSEVAKYMADNFIAVKLNAESASKVKFMGESYTEQQLAQGFGVTGFPSTIFFDEKQQPITVVPGYLDDKQFLNILKFINEGAYKNQNFEDYMKGK